jgi:hypothetical protein
MRISCSWTSAMDVTRRCVDSNQWSPRSRRPSAEIWMSTALRIRRASAILESYRSVS